MKSLIQELIFLISSFIAASMLCFEIYPQYHEWCILWIYLGYTATIADMIRRMVTHQVDVKQQKIISLIIFISLFIAASMLYFKIYPQCHEWCILWIYLGYIVALADVIRKMVVHRREKNHRKDIQK